MKVLIVHNRYVSAVPSGENSVVDAEIAALRASGVQVVTHIRSSDEIAGRSRVGRIPVAVRPVWSFEDTRKVSEIIARERPDALHLHNPNPLISMGVVRVSKRLKVPVVQTVHNHRHTCLNGMYLRDGHDCRDCLGRRVPWPGMVHACYRGSRPQSVAMGSALALHKGTYRMIDRLIALTPEIADSLAASGFARDRIVIKPNFVPDPGPPSPPGRGVVFVGRLRAEKGIDLLLDAWAMHPDQALGPLTFVGDGPEAGRVERAARTRADVVYAGRLPPEGVRRAMQEAAAVVVPSIWPEALPLVVLEAFANGRPVVATAVGGLPDIVTPDVGWVSRLSPGALAAALAATAEPGERWLTARRLYERRYHPDVVIAQLIDIYQSLVSAAAP